MSRSVPPDKLLPFRAHMTRRLPDASVTQRVPRILIRTALFGVFIGVMLVVITIMITEIGPDWNPLYWFHDQVYLYIKGYFYYRNFPQSIIKWGVLATLTGLVAASLISDRSFTKKPQIMLLRRLLNTPYLYRSAQLLAQLHIKPALICDITHTQFELALAALADDLRSERAEHTLKMLRLYLKYSTLCKLSDPMHHLERVYHTLVVMQPHARDEALKPALNQLEKMLQKLLPMLRAAAASGESESEYVFMPSILLQDIETLLVIDVGEDRRTDDIVASEITVLQHIEARARLLMQVAYHLQQDATLPRTTGQLAAPTDSLTNIALPERMIDAWGRIAMDITVHFVWLAGDARLAQIYLESSDSLSLMLITTGSPTDAAKRYRSLLGYADQDPDEPYPILHWHHTQQLLAELLTANTRQQHHQWQATLDYAHESLAFTDDDIKFDEAERSISFTASQTKD